MNKWIILNNGKEYTFDNFEEALKSFLITISDHLWEYSFNNKKEGAVHVYDYSTLPDNIDALFAYKYGERTITDEEIVLENRLKMLLDYMLSKNPKEKKENTLKSFKQSVHYKGEEKEISTRVEIDIDYKEDEVILDLRCDDGDETYFKTNAFIFDDVNKTYYFKSHQIVTTSSIKEQLGEVVDMDVELRKVN